MGSRAAWKDYEFNPLCDAISSGDVDLVRSLVEPHGGKILQSWLTNVRLCLLRSESIAMYELVMSCFSKFDERLKSFDPIDTVRDGRSFHREQKSAERLSGIRNYIRYLLDHGWRFYSSASSNDAPVLAEICSDEPSFLLEIVDKGYGGGKLCIDDFDLLELLLEGGNLDVLLGLLERGVKFELRRYKINRLTNERAVNELVDRSVEFYDVQLDVIGLNPKPLLDPAMLGRLLDRGIVFKYYAAGMLPRFWSPYFDCGRVDYCNVLLGHGYKLPTGKDEVYEVGSPEMLQWMLEKGMEVKAVSAYSNRDALISAAHASIAPYAFPAYNESIKLDFTRDESIKKALRIISDSLDAELIGAYLKAGFTDGMDPGKAIEQGREDLLELYRAAGVKTAPRVLKSPEGCFETLETGTGSDGASIRRIVVPDGIRKIEDEVFVFHGSSILRREFDHVDSIVLPEGLEAIGNSAFSGRAVKRVELPRTVRRVGLGAFYGSESIVVYDSIDPIARPASEYVDEMNGEPNSTVGWLGLDYNKRYTVCAANEALANYEIVVKSAETGEVLYKVWMPLKKAKRKVYCTLVSSWGRHATFAFDRLDALFDELPSGKDKVRTAINRVQYPVDLSDEMRKRYCEYLASSAKTAVSILAETDDVEALKVIEPCGLIKKSNLKKLIECCTEAPCMREYLLHATPVAPERKEKPAPEMTELSVDDGTFESARPLPDSSVLEPLDGLPLRFGCEVSLGRVNGKGRQQACLNATPGSVVDLVREPDNESDPNAIRVEFEGDMLGYVPREFAEKLAPVIDSGARAVGRVLWQKETTTTKTRYVDPRIWILIYAQERYSELAFIAGERPYHDIFSDRDKNIPERCFYLPDDDVSGRRRIGDVIVSADGSIMVGTVAGAKPAVLVVPEGVREIAPSAGEGVVAGGLLLPRSLETIRQFAFTGTEGWNVRVPAGVSLIEPGAFYTKHASQTEEWNPCYFEVDPENEKYFSESGSLLERSGEDVRLLYLFYEAPPEKRFRFDERRPAQGYDLRIPDGVTSLTKNFCVRRFYRRWAIHVTLPESLRRIEPEATLCLQGINDINLPKELEFDDQSTTFADFLLTVDSNSGWYLRRGDGTYRPASSRFITVAKKVDNNSVVYTGEGETVCPIRAKDKKGGGAR